MFQKEGKTKDGRQLPLPEQTFFGSVQEVCLSKVQNMIIHGDLSRQGV